MRYWKRWIADIQAKTSALTLVERGAYTELLDHYYMEGGPISGDAQTLYRVCRAFDKPEREAIDRVLAAYFHKTEAGRYMNRRAQEEIERTEKYSEEQRERSALGVAARRADKPQKKHRGNGIDTTETWSAYSAAYAKRYGQPPVRNARVNGQLSQFVQRLGRDDSPQVAAFFLTHSNSFYITKGHAVGVMLSDAEKLRTEWATGRRVTQTEARQKDKTQGLSNAFAPLIEEARRKENGTT